MDKIISLSSLGKFWQNVQNCIPTNTSELINDSNFVTTATTLEICACTDARELTFTVVYNPNNNNFNIYSMTQESGELIIKTKQYSISGDYISVVNGIGGMTSISSNGIIVSSGNNIGIYKIIGY